MNLIVNNLSGKKSINDNSRLILSVATLCESGKAERVIIRVKKQNQTMKKIQYIAPSIKVANVKLQSLLAGSAPEMVNETTSTMDAKGASFMDDEEDEF